MHLPAGRSQSCRRHEYTCDSPAHCLTSDSGLVGERNMLRMLDPAPGLAQGVETSLASFLDKVSPSMSTAQLQALSHTGTAGFSVGHVSHWLLMHYLVCPPNDRGWLPGPLCSSSSNSSSSSSSGHMQYVCMVFRLRVR